MLCDHSNKGRYLRDGSTQWWPCLPITRVQDLQKIRNLAAALDLSTWDNDHSEHEGIMSLDRYEIDTLHIKLGGTKLSMAFSNLRSLQMWLVLYDSHEV